jgi:hypothetical protein
MITHVIKHHSIKAEVKLYTFSSLPLCENMLVASHVPHPCPPLHIKDSMNGALVLAMMWAMRNVLKNY